MSNHASDVGVDTGGVVEGPFRSIELIAYSCNAASNDAEKQGGEPFPVTPVHIRLLCIRRCARTCARSRCGLCWVPIYPFEHASDVGYHLSENIEHLFYLSEFMAYHYHANR
jgi:hypothetical protein